MVASKKYSPIELMKLAIEESHNSISEHTDKTDPFVGAIITNKDGGILDKAHRGELRVGEHCEYLLIERKLINKNLKDCILYVTIEPCTDKSRTIKKGKKGCSTHIRNARIAKVYVGIEDPNPNVAKKGIDFLISNGINVIMFPEELANIIRKDNKQFINEKEYEAKQIKMEALYPKKLFLEKPTLGTSITDFSGEAIHKFMHQANMPFEYPSTEFIKWCIQFGLFELRDDDNNIPTYLGILLFGKRAELSFPQSVFKVEINYGDKEPEIKDFSGPLVLQLPKLIDFIKDKALKLTIDRSKGIREVKSNFPFEIIREAIANAIIHRDYSIEGTTNYMYIDSDKIIIRSPGEPIAPITYNMLKKLDAPSVSRNPRIMYIFNQMCYAEQRGVGLRSMKKLPSLGFPLPIFKYNHGIIEITFSRNVDYTASIKTDKIITLSNEERKAIIFIQQEGEINSAKYAKHFNLNQKTAKRHLERLVVKGFLIKEGTKRWTIYKPNYSDLE